MACLISIAQVLMFCYVPFATLCVLVNYVKQVHKHVFNIHWCLCSSVVLTKSNGKYWAGRVNAFLSHAPPGWEDCHLSEEANVAEVDWFADAVPAAGISDGLSVCLGCPVFKRDFKDDRTGNLWPMERLTPCKLASLPHSSYSDNLVVLSRFASFMHQVPEVS